MKQNSDSQQTFHATGKFLLSGGVDHIINLVSEENLPKK